MHLGIDFLHISMDFGRQVGRQHGPKTKNRSKKALEKGYIYRAPISMVLEFIGGGCHASGVAPRGLSDPLKQTPSTSARAKAKAMGLGKDRHKGLG